MFGLFFVLLLSACSNEIDSMSFESSDSTLNCYVCKNALYGVELTESTACYGAIKQWENLTDSVCAQSSCANDCKDSICSDDILSARCKNCLLNSEFKSIYLNCEMLGDE